MSIRNKEFGGSGVKKLGSLPPFEGPPDAGPLHPHNRKPSPPFARRRATPRPSPLMMLAVLGATAFVMLMTGHMARRATARPHSR